MFYISNWNEFSNKANISAERQLLDISECILLWKSAPRKEAQAKIFGFSCAAVGKSR